MVIKMEIKSRVATKKTGSIRTIFMHADGFDVALMVLGFVGCVGDGLTLAITLFVSSRLMNHIGSSLNSQNTHVLIYSINKNALYLCFIAAGAWCLCFLEGYCWTRTAERQATRMRARYLKAVLRQDVGYFDLNETSTSEVINSVSSDSLVIQDCISEKVPNFLTNSAAMVGGYLTAFWMEWRLAIVGFPFVLLLVIPGFMYGRVLMGLARKIREEYNRAGDTAEQAISSIRTIYAFAKESRTLSDFSAALDGSVKLGLKQGLAKGLAIGSNGVVYAVWAFNAWYGSRLVMYHGARGGTVFATCSSLTYGGVSLGSGLSNIKYFSEAASAGERIMEVIRRVPKIDSDNMEGLKLDNVNGEVEFKHVNFAYPSRPESIIFRDFSLQIPAGKTVALVGGSGSGKSTVISLLQRFYDPLGGEILLDGVAIDKLQLKWLRSQMGLVSQEPALFAASIKDNILFGKEDASMDEVIEAAKASNAHDFISQLPLGYDTQVGERGTKMSGGQKQRIAIARGIIRKPRILLLDEATSALDSESERLVQEALDKAAVGRTTIVIAHRLSTVSQADIITVVQNGQVVETGSHNELIQLKHGHYASLVHLQQTQNPEHNNNNNNNNNAMSQISSSVLNLSLSRAGGSVKSSHNDEATEPETQDSDNHQSPAQVPSLRRLLALNLPEWKQACIGSISAVLFGAVQPTYTFMLGSMLSMFFSRDHEEIKMKMRIYAAFFSGLGVFSLMVNVCQHYSFAYMGEYLTKRIRERMLAKILSFEVGWFDQEQNSTGVVCSKLAKDANVVRSLVGDRMSLLVQTISAVTIACTMGLIIAWRLAIVMIAVQPIIILCFYTRRVLLRKMANESNKAQEESIKLAKEAVSNLRTIAAFSSQSWILKMVEKAQEIPSRENIRQSWYAGIGLGTSQGLVVCTWALGYWYGGKLVADDYISPRSVFQTFMIVLSTGRVIAEAGSMTSDLAKGSSAVGSVFTVLDRVTQIEPDDPEGYHPDKIAGNVEIQDVAFAYPTRPDVIIFKHFSLTIQEGTSTALVGSSGSGKSSIIGLIERFYDPLRGVVKIDGRDIKTYHLRSLRRHIALVSQEPTLFAGTIRENIIHGSSDDVDEYEIVEAAKVANAHDFISGLEDGYNTRCGGVTLQLSGGQKQRIALARAILRNPAMLLLDEATSALDSQSENLIVEALGRVMVGRTMVVVAHRLSTIQNCGTIVVLDKGEVVEQGTHLSLLDKGPRGAYYSLVNAQRAPNFRNSHDNET